MTRELRRIDPIPDPPLIARTGHRAVDPAMRSSGVSLGTIRGRAPHRRTRASRTCSDRIRGRVFHVNRSPALGLAPRLVGYRVRKSGAA